MSETKLAEYGLQLPPPVFRAQTLSRSVASVYGGAQKFERDELIALIEKEHGEIDKDVTERFGFWRAAISNSSLDSYFTRMAKSSLNNYAADASSPSISFQNSHRHNELPVGRSVIGQFIENGNTPEGVDPSEYFPAVIVDFYSHRDLTLGEVSVEQFLLGVQTHVIKDVSIGFKEGEGFRYTCSICGADYWSWDCPHVAGVEYEKKDAGGVDPTDGEPTMQLCFVWIENARLSEVSAVYDGATPNAMMIKAEREIRAGRMQNRVVNFLERRFRFRAVRDTWIKGVDLDRYPLSGKETENDDISSDSNSDVRGENDMNDSEKLALETATRSTVAAEHKTALRSFADGIGLSLPETVSADGVLDAVRSEFDANKSKAAKYDEIRSATIDAALQEKVRAEGDGFDEAKKTAVRSMLESCDSIDAIQEFGNEWKRQGDAKFGAGRRSADETDDPNTGGDDAIDADRPEILRHVPLAALGGGV